MKRRLKKRPAMYQTLEPRQLLAGITFDPVQGVVRVEGTAQADDVRVDQESATEISVELVGVDTQTFDQSLVQRIVVAAYGGDDRFRNDTNVPSLVFGHAGNDDLSGGAGDDELRGGEGDDDLDGGGGDDFLSGDNGNDQLDGGTGNDFLVGGEGNDEAFGRAGDDTLLGNGGNDFLRGDNGNDRVFGNAGADEMWGGDGDDLLLGHEDDDVIFGDDGVDQIYGLLGNDTVIGGSGDDNLVGGLGDDNLSGNDGEDRLDGGDGDDWISGGRANDRLLGGDGRDRLIGGRDDDQLWGGLGNDHLIGSIGNDQLFGNDGIDRLFGDIGDDTIYGNQGADVIDGGSGDDLLIGGEDDDLLFGRDGDDQVFGNTGEDFLNGGGDDDRLFGDLGDDTVLGGEGRDLLLGLDGDDYLRGGDGSDTVYGGVGNDRLIGDAEDDRLFGQAGDDYLRGGLGNDILIGSEGVDILDGGENDDDVYATSEDRVIVDDDDATADGHDHNLGRPLALSNRVTVSFPADGTPIFHQLNSLYSSFESILTPQQIQDSVLRAFSTWGQHGNLDVGLVADSGDPFGASGASFGDPRFGDVRIGAIPLPADINAIAIGQEDFVVGTWAGEILFNSNANFQDAEEFFATALHEVGHVLGLGHTRDVNRVMHRFSNRTTLHAQDIAEFKALYGTRRLDPNEDDSEGNGSFVTATDLRFESVEASEGAYPAIAFADLSESVDVDFFRIRMPDDYTGDAKLFVTSEEISQLEFTASLYDENQQLMQQLSSTGDVGDTIRFDLGVKPSERFFVKVESIDGASVGGFSVAAYLESRSLISEAEVLAAARDRNLIYLQPDELAEFLADPDAYLIDDDGPTNDDPETATELETSDGFELNSRYQYQASLRDAADVDFYRFTSSDDSATGNALNISVRSLKHRGMTPKVLLLDTEGNEIPTEVAVNGNGEYVIQLANVQPSTDYLLAVQADTLLGFEDGNYELVISHSRQPLTFEALATGQLSATEKKYHSMHVAIAQTFQFGLEASESPGSPSIWATIYDQAGRAVYQVTSRAGERRTSETVMLLPGSYTIEIEGAVGDSFTDLTYQFLGVDVGDPQGPKFTDPSDSPFEQNDDGDFVFPDDIVSKDNFVVVDGVSSNQSNPPSDSPPTNLYNWYWGLFG